VLGGVVRRGRKSSTQSEPNKTIGSAFGFVTPIDVMWAELREVVNELWMFPADLQILLFKWGFFGQTRSRIC
jgi:hypothetical protein